MVLRGVKEMKAGGSTSADAAELYRRAADQVALRPAATEAYLRELDAKRLVHELQVHQIELQMQNAELQRSTLAQELLLEEYRTLYDFAPVGYMSLDRDGLVLKNNLAGAALFGTARSHTKRAPFSRFVVREDRDLFAAFLRKVFSELSGKTTCELRLTPQGSATIFAQLEVQACGSASECLVAIIDVSNLRHEEQKSHVAADRLKDSFGKLEKLTAELNLTEERQRRQIALALHDQVVQSLAIGKMSLDNALQRGEIPGHPVLFELQGILESSMLQLRDVSRDLSPPMLYDLGLLAAMANTGESLANKHGFQFLLLPEVGLDTELSEDLTISVFQFYRELLMNIVKHARAANVTVTLQLSGSRLLLGVKDDGLGFDCSRYREGFGLANIRQRVNYLRGNFQITSSSGCGTYCEISLDTN
jgi:signal transduction histidine kinase